MTETTAGLVLDERDRLRRLVAGHGAERDGSGYDLTGNSGDFDYEHDGRRYNVTVRLLGEVGE